MTATHTTVAPRTPVGSTRSGSPRWPVLLAGVLPAVLLWAALVPIGGVELSVMQLGQPAVVELPAVVVAGLVAALGALVVARFARRSGRPRRAFVVTTGAVLLASLIGPPLTAQTTAATVSLMLLHLVVGAPVIATVATRLPVDGPTAEVEPPGSVELRPAGHGWRDR